MRLIPPNVNEMELIDKVVAERQAGKHAKYFNEIKDDWKLHVQSYIESKGNPEYVNPWFKTKGYKDTLINLYSKPQEGSVQKPILQTLRSRVLQLCPACGEDGTPNTLDHYLPKNIYPEFVITPLNLSPMCDICQGEKGDKILNDDDQRMFLHPYFDEFIEQQVVMLKISKPFEAPTTISVIAHPDLEAGEVSLVSRHLHELGITKRYHHYFRNQYIRLLRLVSDIRMRGLNVRQSLELFCANECNKSVNSWSHIFYNAVLANEELMIYLETETLPNFL